MQLVFTPEALKELLDAQAWYEDRSPGLGFEFARAVDSAVARALRLPLSFACVEDEFRHVTTRKFPYSIIYHSSGLELVWSPAFITVAGPARGCEMSVMSEVGLVKRPDTVEDDVVFVTFGCTSGFDVRR